MNPLLRAARARRKNCRARATAAVTRQFVGNSLVSGDGVLPALSFAPRSFCSTFRMDALRSAPTTYLLPTTTGRSTTMAWITSIQRSPAQPPPPSSRSAPSWRTILGGQTPWRIILGGQTHWTRISPVGLLPLGVIDIGQDSNVLHWLRHHSFPDSVSLGAERHRITAPRPTAWNPPNSGGAVPFRLLRRFDLRWLKVPLSGFLFLGFDPGRGGDSSGTHAPSRPRTRISVTAVAVVHVNGCSTGCSVGRARSCSFSLTS